MIDKIGSTECNAKTATTTAGWLVFERMHLPVSNPYTSVNTDNGEVISFN